MENKSEHNNFNPSGVGIKNENFVGLPFTQETARVILLPVPWDVTVSYGEGTALAPVSILEASTQIDLYDSDVKDAWIRGIYFQPVNNDILKIRNDLRPKAKKYIDYLECGGKLSENTELKDVLSEINTQCEAMNFFVYKHAKKLLNDGKLVGLVGGDHSTPLGYLKALTEKYDRFGILQIDAHMDLRKAYEGFIFSHASVFYNALQMPQIKRLVQVGIRDYCEEELELVEKDERHSIFFDQRIKEQQYQGTTWNEQITDIIGDLPGNVYISFDVDGLDPKLCPNTGTPVPGGFNFNELVYLFKKIKESGRKIIGFDVCETGNSEWDANVAARIIYKLCNLAG